MPSSYPAIYFFDDGVTVELEAVAAPGYSFVNWSGALSDSQNPTTITMICDKKVTAHFTEIIQTTYDLTVDVNLTDTGNVEVDGTAPSSYPATYTFAHGASVSLEAAPTSGYDFANWSGALSGSENPTTITMDSGKEVTANFVQTAYTLTHKISPSGGGTVTLEPSQPAGYVTGTGVTLTAIASEGYEFDHWSGALSGSENPTIITMDSGKEVGANFTEVTSSPFPWWWIVVGVVVMVIGLLIYFVVI